MGPEFILRAAHPPLLVSVGCAPFGQGGLRSRVLFWPNRQIDGSPNLSAKAWKCKVRSNAALKIGPRPWALFVLRVRRDFDAVVHGSFQIARFVVRIWTFPVETRSVRACLRPSVGGWVGPWVGVPVVLLGLGRLSVALWPSLGDSVALWPSLGGLLRSGSEARKRIGKYQKV